MGSKSKLRYIGIVGHIRGKELAGEGGGMHTLGFLSSVFPVLCV